MKDLFHQTALNDIKNSSKLKLYSLLKTETGTESYLLDIKNVKHRQALTRPRLSSHLLTIETGRHKKIQKEERICPICKNGIEDEAHLLIRCPSYEELRGTISPTTAAGSDLERAVDILTRGDLKKVSKFVYNAFAHRDILIDVQSTILDIVKKVETNCRVLPKKGVKQDLGSGIYQVSGISHDSMKMSLSRVYHVKGVSLDGTRMVVYLGDQKRSSRKVMTQPTNLGLCPNVNI